MGTTIVSSLVGLICTIVSGTVTFLWQRRKYNTEVDSQQIKNMESTFDVYKKMMENNLAAQKETMETVIDSQNQKIEMLQKENESLKEQVGQLQIEMINILGSICLDATCKLRKQNLQEELKVAKKTKSNNKSNKK